jgi:hypothetical protein
MTSTTSQNATAGHAVADGWAARVRGVAAPAAGRDRRAPQANGCYAGSRLGISCPAARRRRRPLRATAKQYVSGQFAQAQAFLTWLHQHDIDLGAVAQADVQTWYASHRVHQSACITVVWSRRPNAFRGDLRAGAVRDAIWPAASRGGQ